MRYGLKVDKHLSNAPRISRISVTEFEAPRSRLPLAYLRWTFTKLLAIQCTNEESCRTLTLPNPAFNRFYFLYLNYNGHVLPS